MHHEQTAAILTPTEAGEDTIGGRISLARDALGLSVEDIAGVVGVTTETWTNWENDRSEPRSNRLDMVARVLQVSVSWLLDGRGVGPQWAEKLAS